MRRRLLATATVSVAILLVAAKPGGGPVPSATPAVPGGPGRESVEVRRGPLRNALYLDGELRAVRSRTIFANTSDEVKIVYLPPEGTVVKQGERLVELDSTTVADKIKEAEEKIIAAENEIVKTRSTHESALRDMEVELSRLWLAFEQAKVKADVPVELVSRR